jgi:hypothetical protein
VWLYVVIGTIKELKMSESPMPGRDTEQTDWAAIQAVATQNYGEAARAIYENYDAASRPSYPNYDPRQLPGGVRVWREDGLYFAPGQMKDTSGISNGEGSSVNTFYTANPLGLYKNVYAETKHTTDAGFEVLHKASTSTVNGVAAEVFRSGIEPTTGEQVEYRYTFKSPKAAALITKLALKRNEKSVARGKEEAREIAA